MQSLNYETYLKKLHGCYLGKAVGGTLGMPREGTLTMAEVSYYDPVPDAMVGNDDLDLQVIALEVLRRYGLPVNAHDLAHCFTDHIRFYPDEYGVAAKNLSVGVYPPLSGKYGSRFGAGMGAAIRSELWAALAPESTGAGCSPVPRRRCERSLRRRRGRVHFPGRRWRARRLPAMTGKS